MKKFLTIYAAAISFFGGLILLIWGIAEFFTWLSAFGIRTTFVVGGLLILAAASALTVWTEDPDGYDDLGPP